MRMMITGAGGGIGRAVAKLTAQEYPEARLALVDRSQEILAPTIAELKDLGANALSLPGDLASADVPADLVQAAVKEFGGLDVLVSNAGVGGGAPLKDLSVNAYDTVFNVNARATWLLAKAAYDALRESKGAIVATTSISARYPTPPMGAYSPAKAALLMLVRQLALEWGPDGIRVNCVAPGPTDTGLTHNVFGKVEDPEVKANRDLRESMIPLRRIGKPENVAEAILFLASARSSQITGIEITVDGGLTQALMPVTGGASAPARGMA
jgi:NAD(P)-dependent dehydrogenase (short-subunit alcohol dehydrogenase family)